MIRIFLAAVLCMGAAAVFYPALTGAHHHRAAVRQEQEARHG